MFQIELYETADGKVPVADFINSLDTKTQSKLHKAIDILMERGHEAREPLTKSFGEGLFELRALLSENNIRLIFFFHAGGTIVITNGFIKKTNKTPRREISLAKKYRADWIKRNV